MKELIIRSDEDGNITSENKGFNYHEVVGLLESSKAQLINDMLQSTNASKILKDFKANS
jgi:hypothetical protein